MANDFLVGFLGVLVIIAIGFIVIAWVRRP